MGGKPALFRSGLRGRWEHLNLRSGSASLSEASDAVISSGGGLRAERHQSARSGTVGRILVAQLRKAVCPVTDPGFTYRLIDLPGHGPEDVVVDGNGFVLTGLRAAAVLVMLAGRPGRNGTIARCSIGPWPSGIMSLLMGSLYSVPTYHTILIEPRHAFRVFAHTAPLRYQHPSHREMVQSDQGLRFRLTG
jgi:hypothetical protein